MNKYYKKLIQKNVLPIDPTRKVNSSYTSINLKPPTLLFLITLLPLLNSLMRPTSYLY